MLHHWIWLASCKGLGDKNKLALLNHFGDPEQIYFAKERDLSSCEFLTAQALEGLLDKNLTEAQKILEDCQKRDIQVMTFVEDSYPRRLKNIPDPPMVLYYKGHLPDLDSTPTIGVVGTRSATAYGLVSAKKMGYQIGASGGIVVSGMAKGIDAMAMKGGLTAGMPVVGVLGCGVDVVYPKSNKALFADTENYGCILTEFPPKTPPVGHNFPRRNRIISGISDGVLVVEAPQKSGALITAQLALDQGRDVFVVPGNMDVPTSEGSNALMKDGAAMVTSGWDILSQYEGRYPGKVHPGREGKGFELTQEELNNRDEKPLQVAQKSQKPAPRKAPAKTKVKKGIDNPGNAPYSDLTKSTASLSEHERIIVDQLGSGQKLVDDVIADSGLSAPLVLASLTMLEVKGIVCRLPGRYIILAGEKS